MTVFSYYIDVRKHPAWNPAKQEVIRSNAHAGILWQEGLSCAPFQLSQVSAWAFLFGIMPQAILECEQCGESFKVYPHRKNSARFCSRECNSKSQQKRVRLTCRLCDKKFEVQVCRADEAKYCSLSCSSKAIGRKTRKKPRKINGEDHWRCSTCDQWFLDSEFYQRSENHHGLSHQCKSCHHETVKRTRDYDLYLESKRRHAARRRAWKANANGTVTSEDYARLSSILGEACLKCGSTSEIQWDHIKPLSRGGDHSPVNLQPLCRTCNEIKQARTKDYRTKDQKRAIQEVWRVAFEPLEA